MENEEFFDIMKDYRNDAMGLECRPTGNSKHYQKEWKKRPIYVKGSYTNSLKAIKNLQGFFNAF